MEERNEDLQKGHKQAQRHSGPSQTVDRLAEDEDEANANDRLIAELYQQDLLEMPDLDSVSNTEEVGTIPASSVVGSTFFVRLINELNYCWAIASINASCITLKVLGVQFKPPMPIMQSLWRVQEYFQHIYNLPSGTTFSIKPLLEKLDVLYRKRTDKEKRNVLKDQMHAETLLEQFDGDECPWVALRPIIKKTMSKRQCPKCKSKAETMIQRDQAAVVSLPLTEDMIEPRLQEMVDNMFLADNVICECAEREKETDEVGCNQIITKTNKIEFESGEAIILSVTRRTPRDTIIKTPIDVPYELEVPNTENGRTVFQFSACIQHIDTTRSNYAGNGHFITHYKTSRDSEVITMDDQRNQCVPFYGCEEDIMKSQMFFYVKKKCSETAAVTVSLPRTSSSMIGTSDDNEAIQDVDAILGGNPQNYLVSDPQKGISSDGDQDNERIPG